MKRGSNDDDAFAFFLPANICRINKIFVCVSGLIFNDKGNVGLLLGVGTHLRGFPILVFDTSAADDQ